jgi:broad specificity phosphatase PhoE
MKRAGSIGFGIVLFMVTAFQAGAADVNALLSALKQGGHIIVFRHVATDDGQRDVYPFNFKDMSKQRQLSDQGRETARALGTAIKKLRIPIGEVYTSRLNRAVETGKLISGKDVIPVDGLTDSGAGNTSAMAGTSGGGNAELGRALRELTNTTPKPGTNTVVVTHKTNIADAFGKDWGDVREGEATVFRPNPPNAAIVAGRLKVKDWSEQAGN